MVGAVLARQTVTGGIVQDGPQFTHLLAHDRRPHVDRHAGHFLPAGPPHHFCLARMLRETLSPDNAAHTAQQPADGGALVAGECEIVGVACVGEAVLVCQSRQAAVEATTQGVGDGGTGTRPLRQHALAEGDVIDLAVQLRRQPRRLCAEQSQHCRHVFAVADLVEQPLDPAEGNRRKELLEIEIEDDVAVDMDPRIADDGAAGDETVGIRLDFQTVKDVVQYPGAGPASGPAWERKCSGRRRSSWRGCSGGSGRGWHCCGDR